MQVDGGVVGGFNAPKPTAAPVPEFDRSLGVSQTTFGPKVSGHGVAYEDEEFNRPTRPPNRLERRRNLAFAPRDIRIKIREQKFGYQFSHKPHPSYMLQYLDPEALIEYKEKWTDEDRATYVRKVKNALRRKRQGRIK